MLNKLEINSESDDNFNERQKSLNKMEKKPSIENIFMKNMSTEVKAEIDLNAIHHVTLKEMPDTDLPTNSLVYVSYINHPLDFVVCVNSIIFSRFQIFF